METALTNEHGFAGVGIKVLPVRPAGDGPRLLVGGSLRPQLTHSSRSRVVLAEHVHIGVEHFARCHPEIIGEVADEYPRSSLARRL